jgi:hypothetical protein
VLFISSTSVYNDVDAFVTEETIARPATERETITGNRTTIAISILKRQYFVLVG